MRAFDMPRERMTPETELDRILSNLNELYKEIKPESNEYEFIEIYFGDCYRDNTSGDYLVKLANEKHQFFGNDVPGTGFLDKEKLLVISCAYCSDAQKAFDNGDINLAWSFIVDAEYYCGIVLHRATRVGKLIDLKKMQDLSNVRQKIVINDKYDKYYKEPYRFIDEEYKSRAWKNKEEAIRVISTELREKVEKENWPVEDVYCKEEGKSKKKEDWSNFVRNRLNKNVITAEKVQKDARKLKINKNIA